MREEGNSHVQQEVMTLTPPAQEPFGVRQSLTQVLPKAEIAPNKFVMSSFGEQYVRWKQATKKELMAFLKTAWKEPSAQVRAKYFAGKKKVVLQLLVFGLKPMTAEKRAAGVTGDKHEKARI